MKKLLRNIKVQKLFLPLAFVLILAVWCIAEWENPFHPICYGMAALGLLFFILDRQLKPREHERAARKQQQVLMKEWNTDQEEQS